MSPATRDRIRTFTLSLLNEQDPAAPRKGAR